MDCSWSSFYSFTSSGLWHIKTDTVYCKYQEREQHVTRFSERFRYFLANNKKSAFFQVNVYWCCHSASSTFISFYSSGAVSKNTMKLLRVKILFYSASNLCVYQIVWRNIVVYLSQLKLSQQNTIPGDLDNWHMFSNSKGWEGWGEGDSIIGFCHIPLPGSQKAVFVGYSCVGESLLLRCHLVLIISQRFTLLRVSTDDFWGRHKHSTHKGLNIFVK